MRKVAILAVLLVFTLVVIRVVWQMRIPVPPNTVVVPKIMFWDHQWWVRVENNWRPTEGTK